MSETDTLRFLGLTAGSSGNDASDMLYALRLQSGRAEVRESGAYRSEIAVASGDTLRIAIAGGTVQYSKNGAVFYTSGTPASSSLTVKASLYDMNATITNATVGSGTNSSTSSSSTNKAPAAGTKPALPHQGRGGQTVGTAAKPRG